MKPDSDTPFTHFVVDFDAGTVIFGDGSTKDILALLEEDGLETDDPDEAHLLAILSGDEMTIICLDDFDEESDTIH